MSRGKFTLVIIAAALFAASSCATKPFKMTNPALFADNCAIKSAAVMPPIVEIQRSSVKGAEESFAMEQDVAAILSQQLEGAIAAHGFQAVKSGLTEEYLKENSDIKYELAGLQQKFSELDIKVAPDLASGAGAQVSDGRIETGRLGLGMDVAPFAEDCGADALIFVEAHGIVNSEGKAALGVAAAVLTGSSATIYENELYYWAVMVDGSDGKVLTAFMGRVLLNEFMSADAMPGGGKYQAGLDKLGMNLNQDISKQLTRALTKPPPAK